MHWCCCYLVAKSCLTLCDPVDYESGRTERLHFHFHFSLSCIGEGNGNPLQCSCLENPRDGGAWWASVYGVAQSRTRLKQLSSSSSRLQHNRLPYPSLSTRVCSNSCPLSRWCHPTIPSSVTPSPPALNLSQHQSLFQWVGSSYQVAKVLELQLQQLDAWGGVKFVSWLQGHCFSHCSMPKRFASHSRKEIEYYINSYLQ